MVGPVPAGVAGTSELAQTERPQAGGGVVFGAQISDHDILHGTCLRGPSVGSDLGDSVRVRLAHGGKS